MVDLRGSIPLGPDPSRNVNDPSTLLASLNAAADKLNQAGDWLSAMGERAVQAQYPNGLGPGTTPPRQSYGPNGGRPIMRENQVTRPEHLPGIQGAMNRAANWGHSRYGANSGPSFQPIKDITTGQVTGYYQMNPDGSRVRRDVNEPGLQDELASAAKRQGISTGINRLAGSTALRSTLRAVPVVGEAVIGAEAIEQGLKFYGRQREANAQYQSIYGGSNWGTGFHNRRLEEGFGLSQMFSGGLTMGQSREAFRGVSALGFSGAQRSSDLNFISANYKSMGMGVAESLQLITEASKDLNTNLVGLKEGLKSVSDAAKASGLNGGAARQAFAQTYAALGSQYPGAGAARLAGNIATTVTAMGRPMQGADLSGALMGLSNQAYLGSINGLTPTQVAGTISNGGTQMYRFMDQQINRIVQPNLNAQVRQQVNAFAQQHGGANALLQNPQMLNTLFQQLEQSGSINLPAIQSLAQSVGLGNLSQAQLGNLFVSGAIDPTRFANQQSADQQKWQQTPITKRVFQASGSSRRDSLKGSYVNQVVGMSDPVVDMARKQLGNKQVVVQTASGPMVVSMEVAASQFKDQVAQGTATIADTGQSIKDALGGAYENNYRGPDTSTSTISDKQTAAAAKFSKHWGLKNPIETQDAYNAQTAKDASKGGVVYISPSQDLLTLLNFSASGNVQIATGAANVGLPPVPGSK